jgi:hypothetical protein
MRIVLLPSPEGNVIAREDQLGQFEAEFVVESDGQVFYRHPWDPKSWFAALDPDVFREAAAAWNRYCDEGREDETEEEQLGAVQRLKSELTGIGVLDERDDNLWAILVEQAEQGLL